MSIIIIDNFDSYSNGNLNGQGGWSTISGFTSSEIEVEDTVVFQGAKAVVATTTFQGVEKTVSLPSANLIFSFHFRFSSGGRIQVNPVVNSTRYYRASCGSTISVLDTNGGNPWVPFSGLADNTWHQLETEFNYTNNTIRLRLNGGSFTSPVNCNNFGTFQAINRVWIEKWDSGNAAYCDYITYDDLAVTAVKTWDGVARASLKTLNGVASASIKTINGVT